MVRGSILLMYLPPKAWLRAGGRFLHSTLPTTSFISIPPMRKTRAGCGGACRLWARMYTNTRISLTTDPTAKHISFRCLPQSIGRKWMSVIKKSSAHSSGLQAYHGMRAIYGFHARIRTQYNTNPHEIFFVFLRDSVRVFFCSTLRARAVPGAYRFSGKVVYAAYARGGSPWCF